MTRRNPLTDRQLESVLDLLVTGEERLVVTSARPMGGEWAPVTRLRFAEDVFVDGYSTKEPRGAMRRGVGLALVHRLVTRVGGTITASSPGGGRFDVTLPVRVREEAR